MKDIIVIGGGGFAKEVIWLANDCNRKVRGVLDDNSETHGLDLQGVNVLGNIDSWIEYASDCQFVIAIGNPRVRKLVADKMKLLGDPDYAILVHPSVRFSNTVKISKGAIVCAGTILTTDIELGEHCVLNLNVTVGHECEIRDFVTVAPMAAISGNVTLHDLVEVGTGAVIRQGLTLEGGSMLGMGGVLTKNIPEKFIFAGNPAKKLKEIVE